MDLNSFQAQQWAALRQEIRSLESRVGRNELYEIAQVARSVPRYADDASLPTGALGMLACVEDTGALYYHDGTDWQEVSLL